MTAHSDFASLILGLAPAAYWDFAGVGAAALVDRSGNGHTLTATGSPTVNNTVSTLDGFKAAVLNGTTQYFTPASWSGLNFSTFTLVAVVAPTGLDGYIFDNESNATVNGTGWGLVITNAANNGKIAMRLGNSGSNTLTLDAQSIGYYGGNYAMVCCTYDGLSQTLWINGVPVASSVNTAFAPGTVVPLIGKFASGATFFKGGVSDVAWFGGVLSAAAIRELGQAATLPTPASGSEILGAIASVTADLTSVSTQLATILASVRRTYSS